MSKITRKCPNCGAVMPGDAKYCKKCHAKLDSGRVETLQQSGDKGQKSSRKLPWKKRAQDDALRDLPKPMRPAEEDQPEPDGQQPQGEGFFTPAYAGEEPGRTRAPRMNVAPDGSPRPVSTARGVNDARGAANKDKNLWKIIAVLAAILVIIIVAIVLVVRLNRPAGDATQPSQPFNSPNIVNVSNGQNGDGDTSVPPGEGGTPTVTAPPTNTPSPTPEPTVTPQPTPSATPIPTPTATPASNSNYPVTGTNDTVYINGNGVNIRSGPGTDNSILGTENNGYQLQRTGTTSNGWSRVYYKGSEAYVSNTLITTTQPAAGSSTGTTTGSSTGSTTGSGTGSSTGQNVTSASGTVTVTGNGVNIRSGPGTSYGVVGSANSGATLTRTGTTSNGWTQISYNGQTAYIATQYVSSGTSSGTTSGGTTSGTTSGTTTGVTADSGTVTVTGNSVNIRSGPGTNYGVIGSANSGNTLTVTGKSGNWYQVSYGGQTGYISADYAKKN